MKYMGGKFRQSKMIAKVIGENEGKGFKYCEPFCGSMWSAVKVLKEVNNLRFYCNDYWEIIKDLKNWVIYCDPPYESRSKIHGVKFFDYALFWDRMRKLSLKNSIYISNFKYPNDFEILYDWGDTIVRHHLNNKEKEKEKISEVLVKWKEKIK